MWYSAGTINAASGGTTAVGTGTQFLGNIRVGDGLAIQGSSSLHEVTGVTSDTQLTFAPPYAGTSGSGKTYRVAPVLGYDKDLSDAFNALRLDFGSDLANLKPWATAATGGEAMDALGFGATGKDLATAATPDAARTALELGDAAIADVVGTMASGAIIERGSNANGDYVRYADGTQVCVLHKIIDADAINFAVSNYTLPATLATTDGAGCYCSPDAQTSNWTLPSDRRCYSLAGLANSSAVVAGLSLPLGSLFTGNIAFYIYVIGRWK